MTATLILPLVVTLSLAAAAGPPSKRMADGKTWTIANLAVGAAPASYCYDDSDLNCRTWGRLYTWETAQRVCRALGGGWRLPTDDEWRELATRYGGLLQDSPAAGKAAYAALIDGGPSGFDAVLGGGRTQDGAFARGGAHGFYWTATSTGAGTAWFYNFGRGLQALAHHQDGEKARAFAVRCIKD